jgi:uncharacterized protein (DUF2336 family)
MGAPASLLPELEEVVQHGSPEKRAETLRRITTLFLEGADHFEPEHVALFDNVMGCLIEEIETLALAELSRRLAPVANAPSEVVSTLAKNDDISVAGPLLKQAWLADSDLRAIATNTQARLSDKAFTTLVERAETDNLLAEKVGSRLDIPPRLFRQLLLQATEVVQQRLLAQAKPETQAEIRRVLAKVARDVGGRAAPRDYAAALATVRALNAQRKLSEADIAEFANAKKYEETIAALATLCAVPIEIVDRLMSGERSDRLLILARSAGFGWPTVSAIIQSRPGAKDVSQDTLDMALENFERLSAATAQRVVRFWQVRQG